MKYVGRVNEGPHRNEQKVYVEDPYGFLVELPHVVMHSPCGLAWGYYGAGPTDFAWSLFAHVLGVDPEEIDPRAIRLMLDEVIAPLAWPQPFEIDREQIVAWIDSKEAVVSFD